MMAPLQDLTVIVLTHNRVEELRRTILHLCLLPDRPRIIVVDNASTDDTPGVMAREFPDVGLISLPRNIGAAARNVGVQHAATKYVAFCDDDVWWENGALCAAVGLMERHPAIAVLSARVLVGEGRQEDPACAVMARSPLPSAGLPGPSLLGFLAGACVMRRHAFLDAGGYERNFFIGGEEALLTLDLAAAGWKIVYAPQLTAYHHPSPLRDGSGRERLLIRNALWVAWMRLPIVDALRASVQILQRHGKCAMLAPAVLSAVGGLPWVIRKRKPIRNEILDHYWMIWRQRME